MLRYLLLLALSMLCLPARAQTPGAQVADTVRAAPAVQAAPQRVQVFRRSGVHIYSRGGSPRVIRVLYPAPAATPVQPGVAAADAAAPLPPAPASQDLQRLEERLLRRLDARFEALLDAQERTLARALAQRDGARTPPVVVMPGQALPDAPRPAAALPVQPMPAAPAETPSGVAPAEAMVQYVERLLLDTGLFQTIDVLFETDRTTLLPSSRQALAVVAEVLRRHPELRLEVAGHTDSRGAVAYNQRLSEGRAEAVRAYLAETLGIAVERLTARGYGELQPLADNASETGRALNRRVAFIVQTPNPER